MESRAMDGQGPVEFDSVVVVRNSGLRLMCLVKDQAVSVLPDRDALRHDHLAAG